MHNVFFGGISQYYDSAGILVQDNNVPFVKTIARVSRSADGRLTEYKLPIEMPSLLGAGSEFITAPDLPVYKNEVIQLDNIMNDTTLIGYIYGGISSNAPNIFFTNTGTQSSASNKIFKVYLLKNNQSKIDLLNKHSNSSLKLQVLPNPSDGEISIKYYLSEPSETIITLYDAEGKLLEKNKIVDSVVGENTFNFKFITNKTGAIYFVSIETSKEKATQKILLKN
jgi:hypothetical protein